MGDKSKQYKTEIIDGDDNRILSSKLASINNEVRFSILKILRDYQKVSNYKNKEPLYSREINFLLNGYDINITPQMLGQHLKILVEAGILGEVTVKKEIPNKVGKRNVKAYVIRDDAFEDLFLDISFFTDELIAFFDLYDAHKKSSNNKMCTLTIFNGNDKGKIYRINKDDCVFIGRKGKNNLKKTKRRRIILDNGYTSVSSVSKPHLKLFYEEGDWYILDESSSNGTFIGDNLVPYGVKTKLVNNSFLKLSNGKGEVVFYCSF